MLAPGKLDPVLVLRIEPFDGGDRFAFGIRHGKGAGLTAAPSRWTVHAPHTPTPQPYLVPVRASSSRRYQISGIDGSPSYVRFSPLTVSFAISSSQMQIPWVRIAIICAVLGLSAVARPAKLTKKLSVKLRYLSTASLRPKGIWRNNAEKSLKIQIHPKLCIYIRVRPGSVHNDALRL